MEDLAAVRALLIGLGLGLMLGLERERRGGTTAGLRTFGLVGLGGAVTALLAQQAGAPWLLAAVALGLLGMMVAAEARRPDPKVPADTTTTVALLLCFLLGVMTWHGYEQLAVALALAATALLYFKAELHDVSHRLTRQDIVSFLQFALITFVVLPVLPDERFGPYGQLNPYRIWLMVVLTAGISLAGYAALRIAPRAQLVPLLGLLGGLISSTATTLVFSRSARGHADHAGSALAIITIANLVLLVRMAVLAIVIAPQALPVLGPVLALGLVAGAALPLRGWLGLARSRAHAPDLGNPVGLRNALAFGAVYAVVLVLTAALHDRAGTAGVYTIAAVSGLGDMDAIALSTFKLLTGGQLNSAEAARAIVIALCANMVLKATLALVLAGPQLARALAVNYLMAAAGLVAGTLWFTA